MALPVPPIGRGGDRRDPIAKLPRGRRESETKLIGRRQIASPSTPRARPQKQRPSPRVAPPSRASLFAGAGAPSSAAAPGRAALPGGTAAAATAPRGKRPATEARSPDYFTLRNTGPTSRPHCCTAGEGPRRRNTASGSIESSPAGHGERRPRQEGPSR